MRAAGFFLMMAVLVANNSYAQDGPRWMFGVSYESNISYRQLRYVGANDQTGAYRMDIEIPKYGFSAGVSLKYRWTDRIDLQSGLSFSNKGYSTRERPLSWSTPDASLPTSSEMRFSYFFIDIPLRANYSFQFGKAQLYAAAGLHVNTFVNRSTVLTTHYDNGEIDRSRSNLNYGYRQNTLSASLGVGIRLPITDRYLVNLEPIYKQDLISMVKDRQAKEWMYSVGLRAEVLRRGRR